MDVPIGPNIRLNVGHAYVVNVIFVGGGCAFTLDDDVLPTLQNVLTMIAMGMTVLLPRPGSITAGTMVETGMETQVESMWPDCRRCFSFSWIGECCKSWWHCC